MKNKMKEVCKSLNVELGKNFNIKGSKRNPFFINYNGLYDRDGFIDPFILHRLLTGELSIEKDILTDKERHYLASVIEPERIYKNVVCIEKCQHYNDCYISIQLDVKNENEGLYLPYFKENEMYVGMEVNKAYTLRELGLEKKTSDYNKLNETDINIIGELASAYPIGMADITEIYIMHNKNYNITKTLLSSMCLDRHW